MDVIDISSPYAVSLAKLRNDNLVFFIRHTVVHDFRSVFCAESKVVSLHPI